MRQRLRGKPAWRSLGVYYLTGQTPKTNRSLVLFVIHCFRLVIESTKPTSNRATVKQRGDKMNQQNKTDDVLRLLHIQHPIIQAPMVGVSTPQLAAAVSNAGALGSIGLGASTAQQAREMIHATRALTDRPTNVYLFCHAPAVSDPLREAAWLEHLAPFFAEFGASPPAKLTEIYRSFLADEATLEVLLSKRPAVASFHFGLPPAEWIRALRDVGTACLACVTTPEEARLAEQAGVDALIIAQGVEAGGHRGVFDPTLDRQIGLLALIPLQWAGQGAPLARALPASELVELLVREMKDARTT
jgi:nitronate monooxygenase